MCTYLRIGGRGGSSVVSSKQCWGCWLRMREPRVSELSSRGAFPRRDGQTDAVVIGRWVRGWVGKAAAGWMDGCRGWFRRMRGSRCRVDVDGAYIRFCS